MARTNVPKFGNWDSEEDINYTTSFENPRRVSSSEKVNSNNSPDSPNLASKLGARRGSEAVRAKNEHLVSHEDRHPDVGHKATSVNSTHHRPTAGKSSDTHKRGARTNGGGFRSADHSPLHPQYQAKIVAKGSTVSPPSWERRVSSEGTHGLAPSTPGRSRLKSVPRGNETPDRGASVPKFGEWDETDPSSGDGFTHIFNKVKEERHGSVGKNTPGTTHTQHSDSQKHHKSKKSKGCSCLPW